MINAFYVKAPARTLNSAMTTTENYPLYLFNAIGFMWLGEHDYNAKNSDVKKGYDTFTQKIRLSLETYRNALRLGLSKN
jgi:hypothetical protein